MTEDRITKLEKRTVEFNQPNNSENKLNTTEQTLRNLWDSNKRTNICTSRVSEREEHKDNRNERVFKERKAKTAKKNKCADARNWVNTKQDKPKEIHGKINDNLLQVKDKENISKAAREKQWII